MIKKQSFGALAAAVLGLILVLVPTLIFKSTLANLWVLIGISLLASGLSAFLSFWLSSLFDRIKHGWDFGSARDAHQKLVSVIPQNAQFKEIIIAAYTANSASRLLEAFDKRNSNVEHLRLLLKNPISLVADEGKEEVIPNDKAQIENRLSQMRAHLLGDILGRRMIKKRVDKLEIKFYNGDPVLRGIVIDGETGFFSIYTRNKEVEVVDYSATYSATLRLSRDGGYEGKILVDFTNWFNLVWEHGSKTIKEDVLEKVL